MQKVLDSINLIKYVFKLNPHIYYECSNPNYKSYYFSNPKPDTVTRYDPAAWA